MRTSILAALVVTLGLATSGCENEDAKSPYDIEVTQGSSALSIPDRVERASKKVRDKEAKANEQFSKIPTAADKVQDPTDWVVILEIVDAADDAGQDGAYAREMQDIEIALAFIEDEKDELTKKIGGSVAYTAKEKGCDVDGYGAAKLGLEKGVEERVEERLKNANDAYLIIERNEEALGKKNVPALEEMAKDIADASYTVNVAMPNAKLELESMVAAADDARDEIKKYIEEENAPPKEGAKSNPNMDKNKKERLRVAEEKLAQLETAQADAKKNLEDLEQRTKDAQAKYDDALAKLRDSIKAKQKPA